MVSFRAGLGLGLGLTVDTQIGTIMTINEAPSPNLIGRLPLGLYLPIHLYILAILICRLVDLSTCRLVDLSTCRLVDLSTCRLVDLVPLSRTNIYICHLYVLPKLNCRLVDLSTCRPVELVLLSTIKIRIGLGLVCG